MSEQVQEQQTEETQEAQGGEGNSFTQADVDKIVADRLKRERDKVGDVKALRAAADELAAIKKSQMSDAEKQAERVAALEGEAKSARAEALRLRVATKHGISDEDADLFLTGTDEETLTKQAQRLSERTSESKKHGNYVPREGNNPKAGDNDARATARALFGGD